MRLLQQRLAETEAQMTKILQAMKTVQARVIPEQTREGESVVGGDETGETSQQNTSNNSGDAREATETRERKEEEQGVGTTDCDA